MSIDRAAIEAHLAEVRASAEPQYRTPEAFLQASIDLFCKQFDARGWPTEMPAFTVIPPGNGPSSLNGYAGFSVNGGTGIWRMPPGSTTFEDSETTEF